MPPPNMPEPSVKDRVTGAVILGGGIGLMHYTGMSALSLSGQIYYDPAIFALSVVVAVALSALALHILRSRRTWRRLSGGQARVAGALIMGLAITAMHYTGMAATYFYPEPDERITQFAFDRTLMAGAVGLATVLICGIAVGAALLQHRIEDAETRWRQSEGYLRTIIDNSADGILTFDKDRIVLTCNPAAAGIFGRQPAEIVGARFDEFIGKGLPSMDAGLYQPIRGETICVGAGGVAQAVEYTITATSFAGRRIFACMLREVTEQRRALESLRASEERFRSLVQNMPGVVYQRRRSADGVTTFTFMSEKVRELLGLDPADIMANPKIMADTVHPGDLPKLGRLVEGFEDAKPWDHVLRHISKSGELKWVRTIAQVRRMPNGDTLWDGLILDITHQVRQTEEKELLESKLRHAQRLESLGALAGGIAHEFNNMLLPISGLTELAMREVPEGGPTRKKLEGVMASAERAAKLVEKVLLFSRPDESQEVETEIADVVAGSAVLARAVSPPGVAIETAIEPRLGLVAADEAEIHQIVMNLVSNATQAMEGKAGKVRIALGAAHLPQGFKGRHASLGLGRYAKLTIADTGSGMDELTLQRVFDPFYTTKAVGKGIGLGLAVVHSIVTSRGGAIEVASTMGSGTTVDVYLPLLEAAPTAAVVNA